MGLDPRGVLNERETYKDKSRQENMLSRKISFVLQKALSGARATTDMRRCNTACLFSRVCSERVWLFLLYFTWVIGLGLRHGLMFPLVWFHRLLCEAEMGRRMTPTLDLVCQGVRILLLVAFDFTDCLKKGDLMTSFFLLQTSQRKAWRLSASTSGMCSGCCCFGTDTAALADVELQCISRRKSRARGGFVRLNNA